MALWANIKRRLEAAETNIETTTRRLPVILIVGGFETATQARQRLGISEPGENDPPDICISVVAANHVVH